MTRDICEAIEKQIMELGCYSPIEWLLQSGYLQYVDYERWRMGELSYLEDSILCAKDKLFSQLNKGEHFATQFNLVIQTQPLTSWQSASAMSLKISREPKLSCLLARIWLRQNDVPQMDLFMDNPSVVTENKLINALNNRDLAKAQSLLALLVQQAPNHAELGNYDALIAYAQHVQEPLAADSIRDELELLETRILPVAQRLLRQTTRDYVAPAWRRLAKALSDSACDLHASYAWQQMQNWGEVKDSIINTANYQQQPVLLARLAEAFWYLQQWDQCLLCWCDLFGLDAKFSAEEIEHQADARLLFMWDNFKAQNLSDEDFPAWLLLHEPGLIHHIENASLPLLEVVVHLLRARLQGDDEMEWRRQLQKLNPVLLRVFLDRCPR
ncbi:MAG: hypothetical protein ABFS56_02245 [Pseudomonadota bacterium]